MHSIHGENSHRIQTPEVELCVTARAGHLAPVTFHLPGRDVRPYSLSPWQPSDYKELPELISVLRGDFLCFPFGGQEVGPPHGETANFPWSRVYQNDRSLVLFQAPSDTKSQIIKRLSIKPGHHAVYASHEITAEGVFSHGNHPILDLSSVPEGQGRVSVSPFRWASVYPVYFSNPADGASQALKVGATFTSLAQVPLAQGGTTDLTRYPARPGNDDLVMMVNEPATPAQPFAWSAVVFDGYVWFSLKNPADFPATLFWLSNGGRSASPWNSRHTARLGVEEVCSHFCDGVDVSRQDLLKAHGIPTARRFEKGRTVSLRIIQAAALVPQGFDIVASLVPAGDGQVTLTSESGVSVTCALDWNFVL